MTASGLPCKLPRLLTIFGKLLYGLGTDEAITDPAAAVRPSAKQLNVFRAFSPPYAACAITKLPTLSTKGRHHAIPYGILPDAEIAPGNASVDHIFHQT